MKILVVHAYGFIDEKNLGIQSETVCQKVLEIHKDYDRIYLLGGWHSRDLPDYLTSGDLMMRWLEKHGIYNFRLFGLHLLPKNIYPPRDTMEEVDVLPYLFKIFDHSPDQEFDAVGLWYHVPRIDLIYHLRGLKCRKVIPAFSWSTLRPSQWSRLAQELLGIFKNLREQRTHYKTKIPVTM